MNAHAGVENTICKFVRAYGTVVKLMVTTFQIVLLLVSSCVVKEKVQDTALSG